LPEESEEEKALDVEYKNLRDNLYNYPEDIRATKQT